MVLTQNWTPRDHKTTNLGYYKGCYLGGLYHITNTLHMCIVLQQYCSTNQLYEQSHTARVLRVKL